MKDFFPLNFPDKIILEAHCSLKGIEQKAELMRRLGRYLEMWSCDLSLALAVTKHWVLRVKMNCAILIQDIMLVIHHMKVKD